MSMTVGDFLVERLYRWGVRRIYGYPGDGINGVFGALNRAKEKIRFIQVRHEEMAAFMASAEAKFGGGLGVCIATSGPGAAHLLTGLYDARLDHMPVLAITGQQARTAMGGHYQQEVDLVSMFKDVAGAFVQQASTPAQVRHLVDRAIRTAFGERRVAAIVLPNDLQEMDYREPPRAHGTLHSGIGYSRPKTVPYEEDLQLAAEVLNAGERVAILVGAGALEATDEVIQVAEKLGAGVAKALLGKAALPDDLPWVTGSIGLLGTEPSYKLMTECDTLLMIGSGFPYSEFLPEEGQARGVQIDIKADMLSLRYPMEVNLEGDTAETLRLLLPLLQEKTERGWRQKIEGWRADWEQKLTDRALVSARPINPQRVAYELSPRLPDYSIVTSDSGSCANWFARDVKIRRGMLCSLSGGLASMGAGVPYAIAAKFAYPERPVVAMVGDGAMQMNNMAELITVAKYWREWETPTWICCVFNNEDLNQVTWEQRVMEGDPKIRGLAEHPQRALSPVRRIHRPQGPLRRPRGRRGRRLGRGLRRRPPGAARIQDRPGRTAAAAAHQAGAGEEVRFDPAAGRPESGRHHCPDRQAGAQHHPAARRPGTEMSARHEVAVDALRVSAYRIPTDAPEADGTFAWDATTLVLVELDGGGETGLGYTYADAALVPLLGGTLRPLVEGADALAPAAAGQRLWRAVRNLGRAGLAACAISAVDTALWDLKAKLLGLPLAVLLGRRRDAVPAYGSGGFTSYADERLREQLGRWVREDGCRWVKMKVGSAPERDPARVAAAREAIGDAGLFVDANGAHDARGAIAFARCAAEYGVGWFEEPVSSDDLAGLRRVRDALGAAGYPMEVAAGEYAYTPDDFRRLLEAGAVDVLQADASRCGGIGGFLRAAALCEAFHVDLSAHCAPALHLHLCCAAPRLRHVEWFHDHVRIESLLFDGAPQLRHGLVAPDLGRPGHGLCFKHADAKRFAL